MRTTTGIRMWLLGRITIPADREQPCIVHDYFGGYKGVRAAVDRFILECGGSLGKYPIGDGVSIMIAGKWS